MPIEALKGSTILVVDDEPANLGVLHHHLSGQGLTILVAHSGIDAFQKINLTTPDLILLDVMLPDINGFEICRRLKQNATTQEIPVIFITALSATSHVIEGFKAGGVDFITKPFKKEEVLVRMVNHLTLWHLKRQLVAQNVQLQQEISERKRAETALQQANDELEARIEGRTAELAQANTALRQEIAEHKQTANALRQSEERFDLAVKGSTDALWDWPNIKQDKQWWSPRWYELLAYEPAEIEASFSSFKALLHLDDVDRVLEETQRHFETHTPFDLECRLRTKAGQYRWFRKRGQALWDNKGQPLRMAGSIQDVTERRQAEINLRESEERYRRLFESSNDALFVFQLTPEGLPDHFIEVNRVACQRLGYSKEALLQLSFLDISHFANPHNDSLARIKSLLLEKTLLFESVHQTRDGRHIPIEVNARLFDLKGKTTVLSIARDITKRKQVEEQIRNHNLLLEQAVQEKQHEMERLTERLLRQEKLAAIGQISGSIAHELRNPLGVIKQSVFYLNRLHQHDKMDSSNPKVSDHLALIENELQTTNRVITGLLESTRVKIPTLTELNLQIIIFDIIQKTSLNKQLHLQFNLDPEPFLLQADRIQFQQIMTNVLTNAAQAAQSQIVITVKARFLADKSQCRLEIQDNGPGMDADTLTQVFEPLFTTKAKGTGLGLSICKQIIENHGGTMVLHSQPGVGTTVEIVLPGISQIV